MDKIGLTELKAELRTKFYFTPGEATRYYYDALYDVAVKEAIVQSIERTLKHENDQRAKNMQYKDIF